ncbi:MAG: condensation domain-containing protein, partial [Anaerolineales bacterium]|nr:condensation domain-containing protein [Anaerolineales bacterium]
MVGDSKNRLSAEELAELVSGLSTEQLELLELLLKEQGVDLASTVILPRKRYSMPGGNGVYMPLSYSQQRMWFLDQFEPASPFYNIPTAVRMSGQVDVQILTDCLNEIIRRHESLRTTFTRIDGQPVQVIQPSLVLSIPVIDLITARQQPDNAINLVDQVSTQDYQDSSPLFPEALRLANQEARKPFDLAAGPLVRVTLIRLSETEHLFLLTMHHIISDGWSMGVFIYELTSLYGAYSAGKPSPLTDLKVQYADFSIWQREWLSGEMMEGQLAYWINQLGGHPPTLELPADFQRPAVLSSRGASYTSSLSKSLVEGLRDLSQHCGVTMFMTLLAAFNTLLYRYTGQTDLTVGSPIANRSRPELESLIGVFINTLGLRTDLSGSPTFKEVLERVREVALGAYAHQDVPFELVVEKLQVERDLSHNPVFQVMLVLQNAPKQTIRLPGLTFESLEVHSNTSTFDLTLNLTEIPDGMHVSVEYATDLFTADTIQRLLQNWQVLLQAVIVNPEQSIDTLPLITTGEQQKILAEYNQGPFIPMPEALVHQTILRRTSGLESLAVTGRTVDENGRDLTYGELIQDAKRLAAYLQNLGVGPEKLVGVCVPRCVEMIVSLLGILEAGGAYLPLDPKYPRPRLEFMLADSQAKVVLTLDKLLNEEPGLLELFEASGAILVRMDTDWPRISQSGLLLDEGLAAPDNLAYLIYTSGSTGQPKGVQVCHRALANFVAWARDAYHLTASDRVLQFATLNFDSAVEEIYPILVAGGSLVLRPELLMSFVD